MAKDYGRRRPLKQKSSAPKQVFWVLVSFLCGYLTATVFDFSKLSHWLNENVLAKLEEEKPAASARVQKEELPKPRFEFYTLLSKGGTAPVSLPKPSVAALPLSRQTKPLPQPALPVVSATKPQTPGQQALTPVAVVEGRSVNTPAKAYNRESYLIQIASFRRREDAEHMKAALTLKGFDVNVSAITQQNLQWFRVIIGPFRTRGAAEKAQLSLAQTERVRGMIRKMEA